MITNNTQAKGDQGRNQRDAWLFDASRYIPGAGGMPVQPRWQ